MPSNRNNPSFSETAFIAAVDAALEELRGAADVDRLHECRAIFRKRVPFNLRSYVAAVLLLRASGAAVGNGGRQGQAVGKGRPRGQEPGPRRDGGRNDAGKRQQDNQPVRGGERGQKQDRPARQERPAGRDDGAGSAQDQAPAKPREHKYTGEGVVLFVNAGRRQRFYARVAIALLDVAPGVGEDLVGDVRTMDNYSFIEVAPEAEEAAIAALDGYEFKGRTLVANRARKKGEAAPEPGQESGGPSAGDGGGDDGEFTGES